MTLQSSRLPGEHSRGRPLVMLAMLLSVWVGARVILWDSPIDFTQGLQGFTGPQLSARENPPAAGSPGSDHQVADNNGIGQDGAFAPRPALAPYVPAVGAPAELAPGDTLPPLVWEQPEPRDLDDRASLAAGHQLIWMAAMSYLPVPDAIRQQQAPVAAPSEAGRTDLPGVDRWSLDGWALWREGSGSSLVSQGRVPTYGASQAGAVLRYRLMPQDHRDLTAYVRLYRALIDNGESEVAPGFSARPLQQVPVRAHAELRVTRYAEETQLRPAGFLTTELPPARLPMGLRAEAYAQAGYVAGKDATPFVDGQLHVLRDVKRFNLAELSLGAAAWGGAQKGAERVDMGPSLRLDLKIGDVPARLSVDYRERVAGNAEPPSGVAMTLSTRF